MTKVHVVLRKEDIDETALADAKVAVVFDILLATSSITAALAAGARSVIPVYNAAEAEQVGRRLPGGSYELVGESKEGRSPAFIRPRRCFCRRYAQRKRSFCPRQTAPWRSARQCRPARSMRRAC